jgi:hypothetical protein
MASDLSVRAGLYLDRAFNPALTQFPAETGRAISWRTAFTTNASTSRRRKSPGASGR